MNLKFIPVAMTDENLFIFSHVHKSGGTSINHHIRTNFSRESRLHIQFNTEDCFYNNVSKRYQVIKDVFEIEEYLKGLDQRKASKIKVVFGHDVYDGIHECFQLAPKYFTFLRNPVVRLVSYYNYSMDKASHMNSSETLESSDWISSFYDGSILLSFREWFERVRGNRDLLDRHLPTYTDHYCKIFGVRKADLTTSIAYAKQVLSGFYFVGITECFEDFLFTYEQIGCKKIYRNQNLSKKNYLTSDDLKFLMNDVASFLNDDILLYEYAVRLNLDFKEKYDELYCTSATSCAERIDDWTWRMIESDLSSAKKIPLLNIN